VILSHPSSAPAFLRYSSSSSKTSFAERVFLTLDSIRSWACDAVFLIEHEHEDEDEDEDDFGAPGEAN
jgi:hypothetical protein